MLKLVSLIHSSDLQYLTEFINRGFLIYPFLFNPHHSIKGVKK